MPLDLDLVESVRQSYKRCCEKEEFVKLFYEDFLQQSNELAALFANTDWNKQRGLLRASLQSAIIYAGNEQVSAAKEHIETIGCSHNHAHLNIKPEWYPLWMATMLRTIEKCGSCFSPALEQAWRAVLTLSINIIISKYDDAAARQSV